MSSSSSLSDSSAKATEIKKEIIIKIQIKRSEKKFKICLPILDSKIVVYLKFVLDGEPRPERDRSTKVFSIKLTKGTIKMKWAKYRTVLICPNSINEY